MSDVRLDEVREHFRLRVVGWYKESGIDTVAQAKQIEFYCTGSELRLRQCFSPSAPVLEAAPPDRILDVGCGFGYVALHLAVAFPSSRVVACDVSSTYFQVAEAVAAETGLTNLQFMVQGAEQLTSDDAAELVVASNMLNYFPTAQSRRRALTGLASATAARGRLGLFFPHFFVTHEAFTLIPGLHFMPARLRRAVTSRRGLRNLDDVRSPSISFVKRVLQAQGLELEFQSDAWPRTWLRRHVGMEFRRP